MNSQLRRRLGTVALLPLFGLVFWMAATVASSLPGLAAIAVNVHGLGLVSYAADARQRPAPLSLQLLEDAASDAGVSRATHGFPSAPASSPSPPRVSAPIVSLPKPTALPVPTPTLTPAPTAAPVPVPVPTLVPSPTPSPSPSPSPTPTPTPTPTPSPSPTPGPIPVPTPTPSLLPLPLPSILPSGLIGL